MRVKSLKLKDFRGIRDLELSLDCENIVIHGQNGTGKSGIVDALDFLFTGRISRLTGEGTQSISLREHGVHVDQRPEDAIVSAIVVLPGGNEAELSRCVAEPGTLVGKENLAPLGRNFFTLLTQGNHILTRREILRFIAVEPKKRAGQIQTLLNLSNIEKLRTVLVKAVGEAQEIEEGNKQEVARAKKDLAKIAELAEYENSRILTYVNKQRKLLNAKPILKLSSSLVRTDVDNSAPAFKRPQHIVSFAEDVNALRKIVQGTRSAPDKRLRAEIKKLISDSQTLKFHKRLGLITEGLKLIEADGSCPLCGKAWPRGGLSEHLQAHIRNAERAKSTQRKIDELKMQVFQDVEELQSLTARLAKVCGVIADKDAQDKFQKWTSKLKELENVINTELLKYPETYTEKETSSLFSPTGITRLLGRIDRGVGKKYPAVKPDQIALERLSLIEHGLARLERGETEYRKTRQMRLRAEGLSATFVKARDEVLNDLYKSVRDRFIDFYRYLHGTDEANFSAVLAPEEAALNLAVDFHGRGLHSPQALHSEGHQDSMGLCLYLALIEKLTHNVIDLVVLDDVVMSVDATHRRQLCKLLSKEFAGRQFVITTHDEVWAEQLQIDGVIDDQRKIEFVTWDVDNGPLVSIDKDLWSRVDTHLARGDVPAAAAALRRSAEMYFASCCELLEAKTVHKVNARYDLGDLFPAAYSQMKALLAKGKEAESSWGHSTDKLNSFSDELKRLFVATGAEQWGVNDAIHFNNWRQLSREDFVPIVDAFKQIRDTFRCDNCGVVLRVVKHGRNSVGVQCSCRKHDWGLVKKARV